MDLVKVLDIILAVSFIGLFFLLCFTEKQTNFSTKKKIIFIFVVLISIFAGNRHIGLDLEPYRNIFDNTQVIAINLNFFKTMFSNNLEPVFLLMISTIKQLGLGFKTFLFVSAFVPLYLMYRIIAQREMTMPFVVFFLFLLMFLFRGPIDVIRHFFASVLYLSAIHSLANDKKVKYFFKSVFSFLSHYSNIIILVIRPFLNLKWTNSKLVIAIIYTILFSIFAKFIAIPGIIAMISESNTSIRFLWKFQYYLMFYNSSDGYQYANALHFVLLQFMSYFLVIFNLVIVLISLKNKEHIYQDRFLGYILNSQIIGILLVVFFMILDASTIGLRLNFPMSIGMFFLLKELMFNKNMSLKRESKRHLAFPITAVLLMYYNAIIIAYFAGIHDSQSPFFLL